MGLAGHIEITGYITNSYKNLSENFTGENLVKDDDKVGRIILKIILI
jgi:hypothetical protein